MFTGLVAAVGKVTGVEQASGEMDLDVDLSGLSGPVRIGDSIALSGVCCTVVRWDGRVARFHLSPETLQRTWLGRCRPGTVLNLEPALRAGDPLGGHIVQGHVDGLGHVERPVDAVAGGELAVRLPADLARYCVEKGSVTLDGISLTVAGIAADVVTIWVIPHTVQVTTLRSAVAGDAVHVEVDVIAKYVEKMLAGYRR
ncbi:MAG: hypothetical protein RL148_3025 [Planctomycetota bacterium]|jgi:riboflavin synthase